MIELILIVLVVLWLIGVIHIPGFSFPHTVLFTINSHAITLVNFLIFLVVLWAIGVLPSPFREIAGVLFILWLLSVLGFIAIAGLNSILVIAIIVGIVLSIIGV